MAFLIATIMMASNIAPAFADSSITEEPIPSEDIINKFGQAIPYEIGEDENIEELTENPPYSKIYTYKWDYRVPLSDDGGKEMKIAYQPYVASVGEKASEDEKAKVNKTIRLPEISGYNKPEGVVSYDVSYDYIEKNATKNVGGSDILKYGNKNFDYTAKDVDVEVEYRFQNLYDKNQFDEANDDTEKVIKKFSKKTGDKFELPRLGEDDEQKYAQGFEPEANKREVVVSDNEANSHFIFRYNRKLLKVNFDTDDGSYIPNMTLYYGQTIPYVEDKPTKIGSEFEGWMADKDIIIKNGKTIPAGDLIKMEDYPDGFFEAMPAEDLTFTAQWKEKERANYTVQFYVEKPDGGYEFVDASVKEGDTGESPDLSEFELKNERFPEIENLVNNPDFNLNKYYVRNEEKTKKENKDEDGNIKTIQSNGETYYSIYYDRQTYTLIFEKAVDKVEGGHPEVEARMTTLDGTVYDSTAWKMPYKQTVRFGQRIKWPEDRWLIPQKSDTKDTVRTEMKRGEGLLVGWIFNESVEKDAPNYLDTPPYFMTSNDFIDALDQSYGEWGDKVEFVKNSTSTGKPLGEREISIGPAITNNGTLYYVEFEMEDVDSTGDSYSFDPYYAYMKTDTDNVVGYFFPIPSIPGFEIVRDGIVQDDEYSGLPKAGVPELETNSKIKSIINNRPSNQISYFTDFANTYNGFDTGFKGRIPIKYKRNRHKLQFDTDPRNINPIGDFDGASFSNGTSAVIDEFAYDRPYRNELFERDNNGNFIKGEDGKYVLKEKYRLDDEEDKPEGMPDSYKFLGWATDPSGENLIENNIEKVEALEKQIQALYEELYNSYDFSIDAYDDKYFENEENQAKAANIEAKKKLIQEKKEEIKKLDYTMPNFAATLYAKWGEAVEKRTISFGFNLPDDEDAFDIGVEDIATNPGEDIVETSQGPRKNTPPKKLESSTAIVKDFEIDSRLKIKEPPKPMKKGYDFLGWELITYKEDGSVDETYKDKYGVPRLYSFENEIISDIKLRAIWIKSSMVDVKEIHHFYGLDYNKIDVEIDGKTSDTYEKTITDQIVGSNVVGYGRLQGEEYILISPEEFGGIDDNSDAKNDYSSYVAATRRANTYYQNITAEEYDPEKENEEYFNEIHFYYRPYRNRVYYVNYLLDPNDGRQLKTVGQADDDITNIYKYMVRNANRDYDAVNYGQLPGFRLVSDPQVQLFFDVDDTNNKFSGINQTGSDQVNFYYKDVRIIKRKGGKPEDRYVRVTFKADVNGSFGTDENGEPIKEIHYDVIKGLAFKNIPVPMENNKKGEKIVADKGYDFEKWVRKGNLEEGLLEGETLVKEDYTFIAKFEKPKGKLTIKKVFENEPVDEKESKKIMRAPKNKEQLEFEFKIIGPNDFEDTFKLKAGEEKTFDELVYGPYKVTETDGKNYTAYYVEGNYDKKNSNLFEKPIEVSLDKSENAKTLTVVNKNIEAETEIPNENIIDIEVKKIWKGGENPATTIELWRKGYEVEDKESGTIDEKVDSFTTIDKGDDEQSYTFKDLPKHDPSGREFDYYVKEPDVEEAYTSKIEGSIVEGFTVTNTYKEEVPPTPETKTITVKATKIWQGGPVEDHGQVTLQLIRKSSKTGSEYENVDTNYTILEDGRTYVWENLPLKDKENYLYTYNVVEVGVGSDHIYERNGNMYISTVEKDEANSTEDTLIFKVENAYQEPQDTNNIIAHKKWVNVQNNITKPRVFFQLQRSTDGITTEDVGEAKEVIGSENEQGFIEVSFGNQKEFDEDGNPYTYSVREVDINRNPFVSSDYDTTVNGLYVLNTYKTKDPVPVPDPEPTPDPTPDPKPDPDPIIPGEDDTPSTPDKPDEPETPDKPDEPETPDKSENPKPEKPEDKIPEKPEKEKPPVKTENNKTSQSGTKFVKKINQTGTKIITNVKNFLNPTTGIITNYEIYIGLMAASSVGLFLTREKKNKDEE